jgi:hypothetical protein
MSVNFGTDNVGKFWYGKSGLNFATDNLGKFLQG